MNNYDPALHNIDKARKRISTKMMKSKNAKLNVKGLQKVIKDDMKQQKKAKVDGAKAKIEAEKADKEEADLLEGKNRPDHKENRPPMLKTKSKSM